MAEDAPALPPGPSPVAGKPVHVAFDGGRLTSDGGVLVLAEIDRRLGISERLARCIADPRLPERVHHTVVEMIRFRALLIAAAALVGVVRGLTIYFFPPAGEASMYLLMALVLLLRPRGLLGERIQKFE